MRCWCCSARRACYRALLHDWLGITLAFRWTGRAGGGGDGLSADGAGDAAVDRGGAATTGVGGAHAGASRWRAFYSVTPMPLAAGHRCRRPSSTFAGRWANSGATITFGSNIPGETLPLAVIYGLAQSPGGAAIPAVRQAVGASNCGAGAHGVGSNRRARLAWQAQVDEMPSELAERGRCWCRACRTDQRAPAGDGGSAQPAGRLVLALFASGSSANHAVINVLLAEGRPTLAALWWSVTSPGSIQRARHPSAGRAAAGYLFQDGLLLASVASPLLQRCASRSAAVGKMKFRSSR